MPPSLPPFHRSLLSGNYDFLFTSGIFWFSTIFVCLLALAPRYLIMVYYSFYAPDDIEVAKAIR